MVNRVKHLKNFEIYTKARNIGTLCLSSAILNGFLFLSFNFKVINEGFPMENEISAYNTDKDAIPFI